MPAIRYEFIASGQESVRAAFKGVGEDARSAGRTADESMRRMRASTRETAREGGRSAGYQQRLAEQVAKTQEKNARYVAGVKDRYFRDEQKKQEQAERQQQRDAVRALAVRQRQEAQTAKIQQREATKAIASRRKEIAGEIADRQKHQTRLAQISQKAGERIAEGERRHQTRMKDIRERAEKARSSVVFDDRLAAQQQRRRFDRELTQKRHAYEIDKKRKEISDKESDKLKDRIRGGIKGAVIGGGVAAMALGAGVTGAAARDAIRLHEVSNRLSIAARGAGEEAVDPSQLRREFQQTAIKTPGVRSIDVADAVAQFVSKTGNLDVARQSQGVFATVASATGSQVQDVAAAAADLFQKFDINTVEGMADAMAALAFQGKAGAFELKDAASQFAKLSAAASRFGLDKGAGGVRVLGGLTQIARTATGSPEQAATAVEAMFRQFTSNAALKQLRTIGVNPFKDKRGTQTRDIRELIVETITKSGGNLSKLQGIFGDEGIRAISPIISRFNEAQKEATGRGLTGKDATAAGSAAAKQFIQEMIEAPGDFAELQKDAAQAQEDASAKLSATWEKLSSEIGEGTIPIFTKLAETIENSPGAIDAFIGTIDNVVTFLGMLVGATQDVLEVFGLASKKKKTPEQVRDEERKKAEVLQKQIDREAEKSKKQVVALTRAGKYEEAQKVERESADRINALVGKREVATKAADAAAAQIATINDQQKNIRSAPEFAAEYARLLGPEEYKGQNEERANVVARALRDGALNENSFTSDKLFTGETEAARQLRVNQVQARREDLGNAGVRSQDGGAQTADQGMGRFLAVAEKLAAAAGKLDGAAGKLGTQGTPSIVGPSG